MSWLEKINQMKKEKGKTTDDIAEMSGIPKGTLNKLFSGQTKDPQLSTIKSVVHCLGFTLDDLDEERQESVTNDPLLKNEDKNLWELVDNYNDLNDEGKENLVDYSNFLVSSGKYKRNIKNNPLGLGKEA